MKRIIKNIFIILHRGERKKLYRLALSSTLVSILDIVFLIVLLYVVNFYSQPGHGASLRFFSPGVINDHPLLLITVFLLLFALKNLFGFLVSRMEYNFVYTVASRISRDSLSQYLNASYHNYVNIDSSVINRRISQHPVEFAHYVLNGMQQVFNQAVLIIITIVAILIVNPLLVPLLVLILAPPLFVIAFLMKRKLDAARQLGKKTSEKTIQHLQEALSAFIESNIYLKKDFFINRYHRFQTRLNHYLAGRLVIQSMPPRLIEVFAVFGLFVLILVNQLSGPGHSIGLVTIGALMVAAYKVIPGIVKIANTIGQIKTYSFTIDDLLVGEPLLSDKIADPVNSVLFDSVFFSYPGKEILDNFSLNISRGDLIGVTGHSGRGKSTVVNLLLGFLAQDSGDIYINGRLSDTADRQGYWARIAYIKQQPFFLHASIMENITLQESDYNEAKIKKIISLTGIDQFTDSFPDGLETVITENGKNFSGGQRQRIIFARALYKDFDLLILDEPFSELDEISAIELLKQLQKMAAEGKMILLITHHAAALSFCNKKISMDEQAQ